ncbi:MAG: sensor histidine kinase [Hydrogenovibrio sp.]
MMSYFASRKAFSNAVVKIRWIAGCSLGLFLLALVNVLSTTHAAEAAKSYVPAFSVYVDFTQTLDVEQVAKLPDADFKPVPETGYVGGYNRSVHWLKFTLRPIADERLFLRVVPTYQDYLTLYLAKPSGGFQEMASGELVEDWQTKADRAFVFELPLLSQPVTAYLRLKTINTNTVVAKVYNAPAYHRALFIDYTLSGIYIGLLLILIAINIGQGKWRTDLDFRYYLLFVLASLFVFMSGNGWVAMLVPNDWKTVVNYLPQLTTLIYLWVLLRFYHQLFGFDRQKTPIFYGISRAMEALTWLGGVSLLFDFYIEYMPVYMPMSMLYLLLITGFALKLALQKRQEGRLLFFAVAFGFSGVLGTAMSLGGLVSGGAWLLYSYTVGTLASILVFQSIINRRIRQIEKEHVTVILEKEHAQQMAEREKNEKEQKAQFLSMLSHELKTPLAVVRMGVDQKQLSENSRNHLLQAICDMSLVIDRCSVLEKVDDQIPVYCEPVDAVHLFSGILSYTNEPKRVETAFPENAVVVQSDEDWLKVILSNLLDNALKYSPKDSTVQVALTRFDQAWCFRFDNLTCGDLPDPERVFNKYYRTKSAAKKTGSGLGLYIVKRLVDQLQATIEYHAEPITSPNDMTHDMTDPDRPFHQVSFRLCLPITK